MEHRLKRVKFRVKCQNKNLTAVKIYLKVLIFSVFRTFHILSSCKVVKIVNFDLLPVKKNRY